MTSTPLDQTDAAPSTSLLLVDDDDGLRDRLASALPPAFELDHTRTLSAAVETITTGVEPACILCAEQLPDADAADLLDRVATERPAIPFVELTESGATDAGTAPDADGHLQREIAVDDPDRLVYEILDSLSGEARELSEQEEGDQHRSLVQDGLDEAVVGVAIYDSEGTLVWGNREIETLFGIDVTEFLGRRLEGEVVAAVGDIFDRPRRFVTAYERARDTDDEVEFECHVLPGPDRDERWLVHRTRPITAGRYDGGWVATYTDITDQKRREQMLTALHSSTRELMRAESMAEVAEEVVTVADDVLDLSSVVVYYWDAAENTLRPAEWSNDVSDVTGADRPPALDGPDYVGWQAFVDGDTRQVGDFQSEDTPFEGAAPYRSGLLIPLDEFGLLVSGSQQPHYYTESDVEFAETLAANATVAMERAAREQRLRRQAEQLDDQGDELQRVTRTNRLLREVNRAVVDASTRSEIEQAMCDVLASAPDHGLVWVGNRDASDGSIEPQAWAGDVGASFLDELRGSLVEGAAVPSVRAFADGESQVVPCILTDDCEAEWRQQMLSNRFSSTVAVPLRYERVVYGVVVVASERERAFDEELVAVLEEIGEVVANAIVAVARKNGLLGADHRTQLEFELDDVDSGGPLFSLADALAADVSLNGLVAAVDETYLVYLTVSGADPAAVVEFFDETLSADDARIVSESAESCLLEVEIADLGILETVASHGGAVRSTEVRGETGRLRFGVPGTTDVRTFVDTIRERYPSATLVAQLETSTGDQHPQSLLSEADDRLTDRQRDVLQAAYHGGYFEWPRDRTGEAIAERLHISSPTFQQHLREAMRKLVQSMYEPLSPDADAEN